MRSFILLLVISLMLLPSEKLVSPVGFLAHILRLVITSRLLLFFLLGVESVLVAYVGRLTDEVEFTGVFLLRIDIVLRHFHLQEHFRFSDNLSINNLNLFFIVSVN